jgi:site-specific recombinase XerD
MSMPEGSVPAVFRPVPQPSTGAVDPADIAGAFAANTRAAYASDWRAWEEWARIHNVRTLPAFPEELVIYLKALAAAGAKFSTIRRRLAGICQVHKLAGCPVDRRGPAIDYALKRMARELGTAKKGRAEVMTSDIEAMLGRLDRSSLAGQRDAALLLLGFAGAFRASELVGLNFGDLEFKRDGVVVTLRRSKTDQQGAGREVGILYGRRERTCPVRALKAWISAGAAALPSAAGPLFCRIAGGTCTGERMRREQVWALVKRLGAAAGLDAARLGAHSLRVGHVTQALANGADVVKAKEQAGHRRLDTTLGYNRRRSLLADNTSGKLGL